MKREGNLLPRIVARDNLLLAFCKAARARRASREVVEFQKDLDGNLARMAAAIVDGSVEVGRAVSFEIHDPKPRRIVAPCFPERVLHHALMNVCIGRLEKYLVPETYACRTGFGTRAAVLRAQAEARRAKFVLQLDVRHYFDIIDHAVLEQSMARLWKDQVVLVLLGRIVAAYEVEPGKGLPIGALTSQHLANLYLGAFDHFVKGTLRTGYVRYMDDMLVFGESREQLREWLAVVRQWLHDELRLELKPPLLREVAHGFDFLGVRVRRTSLQMTGVRKRRWAKAMRRLAVAFAAGAIDEDTFARRSRSMTAHAEQVRSRPWRHLVLQRLCADGVLAG